MDIQIEKNGYSFCVTSEFEQINRSEKNNSVLRNCDIVTSKGGATSLLD